MMMMILHCALQLQAVAEEAVASVATEVKADDYAMHLPGFCDNCS